jgi:hypothetical protein
MVSNIHETNGSWMVEGITNCMIGLNEDVDIQELFRRIASNIYHGKAVGLHQTPQFIINAHPNVTFVKRYAIKIIQNHIFLIHIFPGANPGRRSRQMLRETRVV